MRTFPRPGIHPPENKHAAGAAIEVMPPPKEVFVPLAQHIGAPAKPVVKAKEQVRRGQLLAEAGGFVSAPVHSPVSGKVKKVGDIFIEPGVYMKGFHIITDQDADDDWAELPEPIELPDYREGYPPELRKAVVDRVRDSGIVGLGGATFPTHVKLSPPEGTTIDTVILNGAECEPYLTSDHRVMLERASDVVAGLEILLGLFPRAEGIIGIEANKPDAIQAMAEAARGKDRIRVETLETKYPQGGEKQLIWALTGRQVPSGGLPMAVGCVVQNVSTAVAIFEAVTRGIPLIQRVATVTGPAVAEPKNVLVRIGTRYSDLIEFCGGLTKPLAKMVEGGPMMGWARPSLAIPVQKRTSGMLLLDEEAATPVPERACIRCARCLSACPAMLEPTRLAHLVKFERYDQAKAAGLMDCIECGSCSYVCPAHIPIAHYIRLGKIHVRRNERRAKKAG